jgi:hypothetical protein
MPRRLKSSDLPAEMPDIVGSDPFPTSMRSPPLDPIVSGDQSNPLMPRSARNNLDRHPNNILAAYMASGT